MQTGDETDREDSFPRISVDNLRDWERIKNGYAGAAHSLLESRMSGKSEHEKSVLRGQLQRVGRPLYMSRSIFVFTFFVPWHRRETALTSLWYNSLLTGRLRRHSITFA